MMLCLLSSRAAEGRESVRHGELAPGAAGGGELAAVPRARGHREGRAPRDALTKLRAENALDELLAALSKFSHVSEPEVRSIVYASRS